MIVSELIKRLEEQDPNAEVRLAMQPSYPFEYSIGGLAAAEDVLHDPDEGEPDEDAEPVLYITEGSQLAYAAKAIFDAAW